MIRISVAALLAVVLAAASPAGAQEPMPPTLVFGYENEGKIDASDAACEAFVKDMVEWSEAETKRAINDVCAARRRHIEAYAAIQKSYKALVAQVHEDTRLEQARSVEAIRTMVKACIDHKSGLTPGGHNIAIDIIPNDIATRCLEIGKNLLDGEVAWLIADPDRRVFASP
jgi:hypothetical protein